MPHDAKVPVTDCVLTVTINYVNDAPAGAEPVWAKCTTLSILSSETCDNRADIDVQGLAPFVIEGFRGEGVITSVTPDFELKVIGDLTRA